jgi:hypothetical protein
MDELLRQESSVPVQARVSIVDLARLAMLWESNGVPVNTMSQLVALSIGLLCQELERVNKIEVIGSVKEAHDILTRKGLYQQSLKKRSAKKITMALGFESLREEGVEPSMYAPTYYKNMHNTHSVKPMPEIHEVFIKDPPADSYDVDMALKLIEEQRRNKAARVEEITLAKQNSNVISSIPEKDKEIIERENAPLDLEYLKSITVKE